MNTLTDDYRLTLIKESPDILRGLNASVYKLAGSIRRGNKKTSELLNKAEKIHDELTVWKDVPDRMLKSALIDFSILFKRRSKDHEKYLQKAFSAIMEASYRALGIRPYMVQTAGALGLYDGYVIEMATGEGKTLTAALTGVLRGWSGYPCHIITANDYLASRDAEKMEPLYNFCGVTVGSVTSTMKPHERKNGYRNDVTYSTAKEVTADFLRDRLALGSLQKFERRQIKALLDGTDYVNNEIVTRGIHTAIIDEADSLLIDEAVTPLIISRGVRNEPFEKACRAASVIASKLEKTLHYSANLQFKDIELSEKLDIKAMLGNMDIPKQFSGEAFQKELIRQALIAREFYHIDKQYVIQDEKIVIVDEFTGRTMAQRSWSEGLHQMVEAKENLPMTPPNETLARLSFQKYFRFYKNLSGMTGTAKESASELWHVYGLSVIPVPPNKPCQRKLLETRFFIKQSEKIASIVKDVEVMHKNGRPVLIGTRSVYRSEEIAAELKKTGMNCRVINAIKHQEEAAIIADAGRHDSITVATNMAGRGTDILLDLKSQKNGGLHVIVAECNESGRIDRQLFGRAARQGDPGSARMYVSMDDELFRRFVHSSITKTVSELLRTNHASGKWVAGKMVNIAQGNAQKKAYASRRAVQKMDIWLKDSLSFAQGEF